MADLLTAARAVVENYDAMDAAEVERGGITNELFAAYRAGMETLRAAAVPLEEAEAQAFGASDARRSCAYRARIAELQAELAKHTPMSEARAREITKACMQVHFVHMGIVDERPPSLAEYSLEELLEANRIVAGLGPRDDGVIEVHCAARLVAALYVAENYHARPADDVEPVVSLPLSVPLAGRRAVKAVCVIRVDQTEEEDDD